MFFSFDYLYWYYSWYCSLDLDLIYVKIRLIVASFVLILAGTGVFHVVLVHVLTVAIKLVS